MTDIPFASSAEKPPVFQHILFVDRTGRARVVMERRGHINEDVWAVSDFGACLNTDLEFECEPMPSSRSDEFLARARFTLEDALSVWRRYLATPEALFSLDRQGLAFTGLPAMTDHHGGDVGNEP